MKNRIILVASDRMDLNKKRGRNEHGLIRMSSIARDNLGLSNDRTVELWPEGHVEDRISRAKVLTIFQAFSSDLKKLRSMGMSDDEIIRAAFVTGVTFKVLCKDGRKKKESIWLSDSVDETIIGGDPEFILINKDGAIVYASEVPGLGFSDQLGSDGPLAELRPTPAVTVDDFIANIRKLLTDHPNVQHISSYNWVGGCFKRGQRAGSDERNWPIGGHIQIGTPALLAKAVEVSNDHSSSRNQFRRAVFATLSKILDEFISIPMIKIEGKDNAMDRRRSYGKYGDHRTDFNRLEYRTLSGEWLTHPELAAAVAGVTQAIAHSFFQIMAEIGFDHSLICPPAYDRMSPYDHNWDWNNVEIAKEFGTTTSNEEMTKRLNQSDVNINASFVKTLHKKMKALPKYPHYADQIDRFIEIISLPVRTLASRDRDLKHTWVGNAKFV